MRFNRLRTLVGLALLLPALAWADYSSTIVATPGLLEYWHLDESSGTDAVPTIGADHGTYTGGFTLSSAGIPGYAVNKAVALNGSTGYVALPSDGSLTPSATSGHGWSFELWFKPTALGDYYLTGANTNGVSIGWAAAALSDGTILFVTQDGATAGACSTGTAYGQQIAGTYNTSAFHHIVGTTLGAGSSQLTRQRLYVDGAIVSTLTSFGTSTVCQQTNPGFIGQRGTSNLFFSGTVDEVAFYGDGGSGVGEMTAADVLNHYRIGSNTLRPAHRPFTSARETWTRPVSFSPAIPFWMFGETRGGKRWPTDRGVYAP